MKIVVGLGNPGKEYARTRHNVGFAIVDTIAKAQSSKLKAQKKFNAEIGEIREIGVIGEIRERILLVKPRTFMNKSGESVKKVVKYYDGSLFVVHDEIDLGLGQMQIRQNIGAAGHKGVQSIIDHLGTQDFVRFRIGVGEGDEDYLLSNFTKDEMVIMEPAVKRTAEAVLYAIENGVEEAMNKFN